MAGDSIRRPSSPWQRFYGWILRQRRRYWQARAVTLGRPAISVGNLHWGGGGKTPIVATLAQRLFDSGLKVAVLSRGYGRRGRGTVVCSTGDGPIVDHELCGDEPHLLARTLRGPAVVVDESRARAARVALEHQAIDVFVLDDAFSHVKVRRDVEILVFPRGDLLGGSRLLPSGRLREPLEHSRYADAAVLSSDRGDEENLATLRRALEGAGFSGRLETSAIVSKLRAEPDKRRRAVLVSGVARGRSVLETAEQHVEVVEHIDLPDHHRYPQRSLHRIDRAVDRCGVDSVVTTSKDYPKLDGRLRTPLLELMIEARLDDDFLRWIRERIDQLGGSTSKSTSPPSTA